MHIIAIITKFMIFICFLFYFIYYKITTNLKESIEDKNNNSISKVNDLIEDNFFVIDSNNLKTINNHIYGYTLTKKGILTNNYYKKNGYYEDPEPQGVYIMIRKNANKIKIEQDFYGSFGLYFYENKNSEYFALSNSFLLLEEYLIGKYNITFNKDFANNLIIAGLCTPSIHETLIKEIIKFPPNIFLIINTESRQINIFYYNIKIIKKILSH